MNMMIECLFHYFQLWLTFFGGGQNFSCVVKYTSDLSFQPGWSVQFRDIKCIHQTFLNI